VEAGCHTFFLDNGGGFLDECTSMGLFFAFGFRQKRTSFIPHKSMLMKPICLGAFGLLALLTMTCQKNTMTYDSYTDYPVYEGDDLGLTYTPESSTFRLWSPAAQAVRLHLYETDLGGAPTETVDLDRAEQGTWHTEIGGDLIGQYYTFQIEQDGEWREEKADPYVRAVGANGVRGQVVDLAGTNPEGWGQDQRPPLEHPNDIIIYELHVRDFSVDEDAGMKNVGKFLALTEAGTTNGEGLSTGLDHLEEMGITHLHLLPSFDFRSIDETKLEEGTYNWGYDPQHYNVPEGSYSTNPHDGATRIREFKQMVKALHDRGIRVVLDVVYNHTGFTETSNLNQLVPGYYYRQQEDGSFSDASACGNETASDRAMMRKFILESVAYWAEEYHLDGFRFDLMGIHDQETMRQVAQRLHQIDPTIFVYGEGWTAGDSPLPEPDRALKKYTHKMPGVAAFTDDMRDALKGHVFTHDQPGFVSGADSLKESVKFGIIASTQHPQVNYGQVNYSDSAWAAQPGQTITYVSCHDNHTLWDRLAISRPDASEEDRTKMHRLALAMVLTSQGVSFLHAGAEFQRTKDGVENSFESPDAINRMDWSRKSDYRGTVEYVKGLIAMRKAHPAFRMRNTVDIQENLIFRDTETDHVIAYQIDGEAVGDSWSTIFVAFNGGDTQVALDIPEGSWTQVLDGSAVDMAGLRTVSGGPAAVPANTGLVLVKE